MGKTVKKKQTGENSKSISSGGKAGGQKSGGLKKKLSERQNKAKNTGKNTGGEHAPRRKGGAGAQAVNREGVNRRKKGTKRKGK